MTPEPGSPEGASGGRRSQGRTVAAVLAAISAAVLALSVNAMIARVRAYYERTRQATPFFDRVDRREFEFHARPVTITDERDEQGEVVVVRYGDRTLRLRPTIPALSPQVPGLARHEAWLTVLRFVATPLGTGGRTDEAIERGELHDRMVVVVRDPHEELDATAHGMGRPSDWTFDLHELMPDGTITTERYGYPLSRRAMRSAPPPASGIPPLQEGTWQYYAALMTIPRGSRPTPAFTRDAVRSMGWTLPAAAFSGLVLTLSVPWLLAPRRGSAPPA